MSYWGWSGHLPGWRTCLRELAWAGLFGGLLSVAMFGYWGLLTPLAGAAIVVVIAGLGLALGPDEVEAEE